MKKIKTWYTCGQWADVSCISESGCCCLFIPLYEVYSFCLFSNCVCLCVNFFFLSKISQELLNLEILKFGTNVGYNLLYCVSENQPPPAYHSLYLSISLSLQ